MSETEKPEKLELDPRNLSEEEIQEFLGKLPIPSIINNLREQIIGQRRKTSPQEAGTTLEGLDAIKAEIIERVTRPSLAPYKQRTPYLETAYRIMNDGEIREAQRTEKEETKKEITALLLKDILETLSNIDEKDINLKPEQLEVIFKELAVELLSLKNPTTTEIIRILGGNELVKTHYRIPQNIISQEFLKERKTEKPEQPEQLEREDEDEELEELVDVEELEEEEEETEEEKGTKEEKWEELTEKIGIFKDRLNISGEISKGFVMLRERFYALHRLNLENIWREREIKAGEDDPLENYASEANKICSGALSYEKKEYKEKETKEYKLHPKVEEENSIVELQKLATMEPITEEAFEIFKSAQIKLEIMHILYFSKAQVQLKYLEAVSGRLDERLKNLLKDYDNVPILNPPTPNSDGSLKKLSEEGYHCQVDRSPDVHAKELESIVRKIILKNVQNPGAIGDLARARIFMPEFITFTRDEQGNKVLDKESLRKEITKVVAILLAEFGDDYNENETMYTINSGGSNLYSGGKHRGIHLKLKMKFQIPETGIYPDGDFKEGATDIEIQILGYMPKDEAETDHDDYRKKQVAEVRKKLGVDLSFSEFVMQLAQVVNSKHDFGIESQPQLGEKIGNRPFSIENYREKMLLLIILTKRDEDGHLINLDTIQKLCKNPDSKKIISEAVEKLKNQRKESLKIKGRETEITKGVKELARMAYRVIKNEDFEKPQSKYEVRHKGRNWETKRTRVYQKGKGETMTTWRAYTGPLYMIKDGRERDGEESRIYTVFSEARHNNEGKIIGTKTSTPKLTHVIEGPITCEKCYAVDSEGEKRLIWKIIKTDFGEVAETYDEKGDKQDEIPINRKKLIITGSGFGPLIGISANKKIMEIQRGINKILSRQKKLRPRLKSNQKLVPIEYGE